MENDYWYNSKRKRNSPSYSSSFNSNNENSSNTLDKFIKTEKKKITKFVFAN